MEVVGNRCGRGFLQNSHDFHASSFEGLLGGLGMGTSDSVRFEIWRSLEISGGSGSSFPWQNAQGHAWSAAFVSGKPNFAGTSGDQAWTSALKNCTFQVWKMPSFLWSEMWVDAEDCSQMTAREISKPASNVFFLQCCAAEIVWEVLLAQQNLRAEDVSEMLCYRTSHVRHLNRSMWIWHVMAPWEQNPGTLGSVP